VYSYILYINTCTQWIVGHSKTKVIQNGVLAARGVLSVRRRDWKRWDSLTVASVFSLWASTLGQMLQRQASAAGCDVAIQQQLLQCIQPGDCCRRASRRNPISRELAAFRSIKGEYLEMHLRLKLYLLTLWLRLDTCRQHYWIPEIRCLLHIGLHNTHYNVFISTQYAVTLNCMYRLVQSRFLYQNFRS